MTAVITVMNSEGVVGRCDANCHNAVKPDCDCTCAGAGANHGCGSAEKAIANNTERMLGPDAAEKLRQLGAEGAQPMML